jgi:deoxyribonuclease V
MPEMKPPPIIHSWSLSYKEALAVQERLRKEVRLRPLASRDIRHVAGADVAVSKKLGRLISAVVVLQFPSLSVVEERTFCSELFFPYIPGLLSFREIPGLIDCLKQVRTPFQAMLCDGQGIAHPRRVGLASHLGVLLNVPTIGCAKSRLLGEFGPLGEEKGAAVPLRHHGRRIGTVLRTRAGVKPIFVSPGHLVDFASSVRVVLHCLSRYRIPEPTRRAHILAGSYKRTLENAPG